MESLIDTLELHANLRGMADNLDIFSRGIAYAKSGNVGPITIEGDRGSLFVTSTVYGSHLYYTELEISARTSTIENGDCTCPYGFGCKHMVALGITYIESLKDIEPLKNIPQEKTKSILKDTHTISISNGYSRKITSIVLTPKKKKSSGVSYYYQPQNNDPNDPAVLLHNHIYESTVEIALLEMIATHTNQSWSYNIAKNDTFDYVEFFILLQKSGLTVKIADLHKIQEKVTWIDAPKPTISLLPVTREMPNRNYPYTYLSFAILDMKIPKNSNYSVGFGATGMVLIYARTIAILSIAKSLQPMVKRVLQNGKYLNDTEYGNFYSRNAINELEVPLLSSEYIAINTIIKDLKETFECKPFVKEEYTLVHHTTQPVVVLDYNKETPALHVYPAMYYGPLLIPISDMWYTQTTRGKKKYARRKDPSLGKKKECGIHIDNESIHVISVHEKEEKKLYLSVRENYDLLGLNKTCIPRSYLNSASIVTFAKKFLPILKEKGYTLVYPKDTLQILTATFKAEFTIESKHDNDWLAFNTLLYCDDTHITLEDLKTFALTGNQYLTTKDGEMIHLTNPETVKRLLQMLTHFRKKSDGSFEGKMYHAPLLEATAMGSKEYTSKVSEDFKAFMKQAKTGKAVRAVRIQKQFTTILREYQKHGVEWINFLRSHRFGGILADDMGLGKTLQAITALSLYTHTREGVRIPSLIVAPKTLLTNWQQELQKFAPHLTTLIVEGSPSTRSEAIEKIPDVDIVITSYPTLQRDIDVYLSKKYTFHYCVLDEAQYIKNPRTKSAHTVKKITSEYRLALTGTPLENSVEEIWSIFDFLMPNFLGNHSDFQKNTGNPIMNQGDAIALAHLRAKISPFMLRRTKSEVLKELPQKIEQIVSIELSDEQNILYQDVLMRIKKDIFTAVEEKGWKASQIHILAGLTKLRQICNHPALVLPTKKTGEYPSAKLERTLEMVEEIAFRNGKVLIFSQFTSMLNIIATHLNKKNLQFSYLSGTTKNRSEVISQFTNDASIPVFLISTKAGGVGINLTVADTVIIFDPWWNPSVESQAIDRAHRIGQNKTVNVYRLRTVGTIEEKIAKLQERKQNLFNTLVGSSDSMFKKLTWEDVKSLLVS